MPDVGVCGGNPNDCRLSFMNRDLDGLLNRLRDEGPNIATLRPFATFFQADPICAECGQATVRLTQPTAGLATEGEEYMRLTRLNQLLEAGYRLQEMGVLPQ